MSWRTTAQRLRLRIDCEQHRIYDVATGTIPRFARGGALCCDVALFYNGELADISAVTAASLTVKPWGNRGGDPQMHLTIGPGSMDPALTVAQWEAGTSQHFRFTFAAAQTGIGTGDESQHWLVIHGLASDVVVWGAGELRVYDPGIQYVTAPPLPPEDGVTLSQVLALLSAYAKLVNDPGRSITVTSPDGRIRRIIGVDNDGVPYDHIERPS